MPILAPELTHRNDVAFSTGIDKVDEILVFFSITNKSKRLKMVEVVLPDVLKLNRWQKVLLKVEY